MVIKNNKVLEKPVQVTIDLTDRCQLKCTTCSKWKTVASDVIQKELTTEEWKKVILNIKNWLGNDGFYFCFSGGEPFLRKDIFELADYAKSLGLHVASMTNAYSIQNMYEKIVDSSIESVNISLNALNNPDVHNVSRGREEAYARTIDTILTLKRISEQKNKKLGINIATVMFPENIDEVIPLVEFMHKYKLNGIMFQLIDDIEAFHAYNYQKGIDTDNYKMPKYLRDKYQKMASRAIEVVDKLIEMKKSGYSIYNSYEQLEALKVLFNNPDDILKQITCDVASTNVGIDPYGDVRLCFNMYPVGNVKENSLEEIWINSKSEICRNKTKTCKMYCRMLNCNFKHNFANFNKSFFTRCKNKIIRILKGYN